jgi:dimethylhistidine N-methyltransferase
MHDSVSEFDLFLDLEPQTDSMEDDVWAGLQDQPRWLPSKYFYDARGSALFDQICDLPEYYPTRTEAGIIRNILPELNARLSNPTIMLEYGSGSSTKTQLLLENLGALTAYVPIDISRGHLLSTGQTLAHRYPSLRILPVCADYGQRIPFDWEAPELDELGKAACMIFFPGSTIGNFTRAVAKDFLKRMRALLDEGGYLLIGVDLVKDATILEAAYNDSAGVTAAFNRNMLDHINARIRTDFQSEAFKHLAVWDASENRIEMRLIASEAMDVSLPQGSISLEKGDYIRTEYSHKYHVDDFGDLARQCGFATEHVWTDANRWFSVQMLRAD